VLSVAGLSLASLGLSWTQLAHISPEWFIGSGHFRST
jgi:hypothetical protein